MQINDFKYESKHTDENMAIAKKWLVDGARSFSSTANYAWIKQNNSINDMFGQVCHSQIATAYFATDSVLIATEAYLNSVNRPNKEYRRYNEHGMWKPYQKEDGIMIPFFEWVVYESVFGRFILNRDDRKSVKRGFIVSTELPASILQSIMILSRHFYEVCPESFELFNKYRADGIPGSVAYAVAFNTGFGCNTEYGVRDANEIVIPKWGHRLMPLFKDMHDFKNFITGNAVGLNNDKYINRPTTNGTSSLFHRINQGREGLFTANLILNDSDFRDMLKAHRGDTEVTSIINPFKVASRFDKKPTDVTYGELHDVIIPYLYKRGDFNDAIH